MLGQVSFFVFWLVFSLLCLAAVAAVLAWAFRAGQFSEQDRARRLPLEDQPDQPAEPPPQDAASTTRLGRPGRAGRDGGKEP